MRLSCQVEQYPLKLPIRHNCVVPYTTDAKAVSKVIFSGYWVCGTEVMALEREVAALMGRRQSVCVASGLAALKLALLNSGVSEADEVIIPAYSCVALPNAVLAVGAIPIPADVMADSWVLDPRSVAERVTSRTKAIIAVHMYGSPAPIEKFLKYRVTVVEDCAHGFGKIPGSKNIILGKRAHMAVGSFYATKFLGAGEGGIIALNSSRRAAALRKFRDYADQPPDGRRGNEKMTDIEAALARSRLRFLDDDIHFRRNLAFAYHERLLPLAHKGLLSLPDITENRFWYRYVVLIKQRSATHCINRLKAEQIYAAKPAENWLFLEIKNYPISACIYKHAISLPFHRKIGQPQLDYIVKHLYLCLESK